MMKHKKKEGWSEHNKEDELSEDGYFENRAAEADQTITLDKETSLVVDLDNSVEAMDEKGDPREDPWN